MRQAKFGITRLESVVDTEGHPERVAETFVEVVGELGGNDEVLVPGQFEAESRRLRQDGSAGFDVHARHLGQSGKFRIPVGLRHEAAIEERIDREVKKLPEKLKIDEFNAHFKIPPQVAVRDDAVGVGSPDGI